MPRMNRCPSFCSDTASPRVKTPRRSFEARLTGSGGDDTLAALPVFTLMSSSPDVDSLRLTVADFDAFLPERATSNAYTRPRLELKQRMLAWAKGVVTRLAEIGIPVDVSASDEHPSLRNGRRVDCQRVFFWRDAGARARNRAAHRSEALSRGVARGSGSAPAACVPRSPSGRPESRSERRAPSGRMGRLSKPSRAPGRPGQDARADERARGAARPVHDRPGERRRARPRGEGDERLASARSARAASRRPSRCGSDGRSPATWR